MNKKGSFCREQLPISNPLQPPLFSWHWQLPSACKKGKPCRNSVPLSAGFAKSDRYFAKKIVEIKKQFFLLLQNVSVETKLYITLVNNFLLLSLCACYIKKYSLIVKWPSLSAKNWKNSLLGKKKKKDLLLDPIIIYSDNFTMIS